MQSSLRPDCLRSLQVLRTLGRLTATVCIAFVLAQLVNAETVSWTGVGWDCTSGEWNDCGAGTLNGQCVATTGTCANGNGAYVCGRFSNIAWTRCTSRPQWRCGTVTDPPGDNIRACWKVDYYELPGCNNFKCTQTGYTNNACRYGAQAPGGTP